MKNTHNYMFKSALFAFLALFAAQALSYLQSLLVDMNSNSYPGDFSSLTFFGLGIAVIYFFLGVIDFLIEINNSEKKKYYVED